ncbi:hypothetical protein [Streptomyces sp. NRRL B-24484]|uniref:hypothetical protein n=1 Tax=Streptomyces sp. NRRL B-24484 TaxID=1463833 RepID=UPI0004C23723|nr:hypothetical protein [Streptomyces sp. NRRL B-24484]
MLEQALVALAASGGTALVTAAGTDTWNGLRQAVARWFGRGDVQREQAELERLDQTAAALETTETAGAEAARIRQEASWQARIEAALENLAGPERDQAAEQLRDLLAQHAPQGGVLAAPGGIAVGGNMEVHAEKGSIAAGVLYGGAHLTNPQMPDPSQG